MDMDKSLDSTTLTDNDVRQIVSDAIKSQLDNLETRINAANRKALTEALATVPTEDTVSRMIDSKIATTRKEFQENLNSIDVHLRQAEGHVSEAGRRMDKATDRFENVTVEFRSILSGLTEKADTNASNLAALNKDMREARQQAESDRSELTQTIDRLDDLKADIHGDPTKPQMPSLFRMIALTNDSVNSLNNRVARYDTAAKVVSRVWSTYIGKAVIMLMLSAFATDAIYQATKIIQAVLTGKGGP